MTLLRGTKRSFGSLRNALKRIVLEYYTESQEAKSHDRVQNPGSYLQMLFMQTLMWIQTTCDWSMFLPFCALITYFPNKYLKAMCFAGANGDMVHMMRKIQLGGADSLASTWGRCYTRPINLKHLVPQIYETLEVYGRFGPAWLGLS